MYERFTDRARAVLRLANEFALEQKHEFLGTGHLLVGLTRESQSIGSLLIRSAGVDARRLTDEVKKREPEGATYVPNQRLEHTPRAKRVITLTIEAARTRGHDYVGTEHLLIGILNEKEGVAYEVLQELDLYDKLQAAVDARSATCMLQVAAAETTDRSEKDILFQISVILGRCLSEDLPQAAALEEIRNLVLK